MLVAVGGTGVWVGSGADVGGTLVEVEVDVGAAVQVGGTAVDVADGGGLVGITGVAVISETTVGVADAPGTGDTVAVAVDTSGGTTGVAVSTTEVLVGGAQVGRGVRVACARDPHPATKSRITMAPRATCGT